MSISGPLKIVNIDRLDEDRFVVSFSEGRTFVYRAEQLSTIDPETALTESDPKPAKNDEV